MYAYPRRPLISLILLHHHSRTNAPAIQDMRYTKIIIHQACPLASFQPEPGKQKLSRCAVSAGTRAWADSQIAGYACMHDQAGIFTLSMWVCYKLRVLRLSLLDIYNKGYPLHVRVITLWVYESRFPTRFRILRQTCSGWLWWYIKVKADLLHVQRFPHGEIQLYTGKILY